MSSTPLESLSSSSGILYGNSSSSSTSFQPPMVHQRNSVSSHQFDYTQDFPHNGGKPLEISYLVHPQMKHFDAAIGSVTKRNGSPNDKELSETFDPQAISVINAAQMQQHTTATTATSNNSSTSSSTTSTTRSTTPTTITISTTVAATTTATATAS